MNRRQIGPRPTNTKGTLPKVLKYLFKYYKFPMIIVFICLIVAAVGGMISAVFLQQIIDEVIMPAIDTSFAEVKGKLISIVITMVVIYSLSIIASITYNQIMVRVTQGFLNHVRKDMFNKMEKLPIKYFDSHAHGDIMSHYTNDVDTLRQFVSQSMIQFTSTTLSLVFVISAMLYYSIWLTVVVAISTLIMLKVTKKIGGNSAKYFMKNQAATAKVEGYIEEIMHGEKVVKVFCHEEEAKKTFNEINNELFDASSKANIFGNILMPVLHNIGNILYIILAVSGSLLVIANVPNLTIFGINALEVGVVVSFLTMSRQFSQNIGQVSQQVAMVAMAMAGAKRVFDFMDEEEEKDEGYVTLVNIKENQKGEIIETKEHTNKWAWRHPHQATNEVTYTPLKGDIVMDQVDFSYDGEKQVLYDVSLYAKPGQKIAFVGATGAGKTTITNLINRFYDIQDGKIRYDSININKIKKSDLRRSLGIVLQDTNLFTGTVMENIRYGRLDATDEEVYEAAKIANAYDFITRLPQGFNTLLTSDGSNLSQGQRQLLSIARAAVANTPVMILDEATSSIDTRTEALVQKGTDRLMEGRTVFVIAHRLSTVQNSDAIMVLDHGKIIERGNHESLINEKGTYYELYTGAFELE